MERIRDIVIVRHAGQYTVRAVLHGGRRVNRRTGIPVTAPSWEQEPDTVRTVLKQAELALIQDVILNPPDPRCQYRTVADAVGAYLDWHAANRKRTNVLRNHMRPFLAAFGPQPPHKISRHAAREWLEHLATESASWNTFRLRATAAQGVITWLQDNDQWGSVNPFSRQLKKYRSRFPAQLPTRKYISDAEYDALLKHADDTTRLFIEISRCTGLRQSEVYALDLKHLNRVDRTWMVKFTKPVEGYRTIAVPARLVELLRNTYQLDCRLDWTNARVLWERTRAAADCHHINRKAFRGDWATRMREAGASHSHIVFQQGRAGDVTDNHYFDEGRTLMEVRMYMERMFGEKKLVRVVDR